MDGQYRDFSYDANEVDHEYGEDVHILQDPVALTQLAQLCSPELGQPQFNRMMKELYRRLIRTVVGVEFPRVEVSIPSRMSESTDRGVYEGEIVDPETSVVTVDIARGGILPSDICYEELNKLLDPEGVRQDHLFMNRTTDESGNVTGARLFGEKVGAPLDGQFLLLPDPMGATGSSMSTAIEYYKEEVGGDAREIVTLCLIITPEFVRKLQDEHPEVTCYTFRLDRGMSPEDVLDQRPGAEWDRESGLDSNDYIVPGGGGFGELMNNAWT